LFATQHCARCHELPGGGTPVASSMPELNWAPPSLADAGARFQTNWLTHWLLDPHSVRNHVTMPRLLDERDPQRPQKAADAAAYRATLLPVEPVAAPPKGDALAGAWLYEDLGCINCHRLTAPGNKDTFDRTTLYFVNAKYRPGMLEAFLQQPHRYYP